MKAVDLDILRLVAASGVRLVASVETLRGSVGASSPKVVRLALDRLEGEALITSESAHVARGAKAYALTEAGRSRVAAAARAPLSETKSTEGEVSGNAKGEDKGKEKANQGTNGGTVSKSLDQRSNEEQANNNGNTMKNNNARKGKERAKPRRRTRGEDDPMVAIAREQAACLRQLVNWIVTSGMTPPPLTEGARAAVMQAGELERARLDAIDAPSPRPEARERAPAPAAPPPAPHKKRIDVSAPEASEVELSRKAFDVIRSMPSSPPAADNVTWDYCVGLFGLPKVVTYVRHHVVAAARGTKAESPTKMLLGALSADKKGKPWAIDPESLMPWADAVKAVGKLPEPFVGSLGHLLPPEPEGASARAVPVKEGATGPEASSLPKPELEERRREWRKQAEEEWEARSDEAYSIFDPNSKLSRLSAQDVAALPPHVVEQHVRARARVIEEKWRASPVSSWGGA